MTARPAGPAGSQAPDPAVSRHRLGTQLRQLRQARALRLADVAAELGIAGSTLSRIETGKAPARASYIRVLLDLYHVDDPGQRQQLTELARQGQEQDWCADAASLVPAETLRYLGLETAATQLRAFAAQLIPGLLQTTDYAEAAWHAACPGLSRDHARKLAALAGHRQKALANGGHQLHAVIDETALLRPLGPAPVMAAQIDHLSWLAAATHLTIQVLPLTAPLPVLSPPFTLLAFDDPADPGTACTPGPNGHPVLTSHRQTVRALRDAFDALARAALPPAQSAHLITRLTRRTPPAPPT